MTITGVPQDKPVLDPKAVAAAILDDATFATVLHVICLASFGEDIYEVDPIELYARLQDTFGAQLSETNEQKLQAILLATSTDAFYEDERAFMACCSSLLGGDPGFEGLDDLTVAEIFWALYEVELNHGENEVSPAIRSIIAREVEEEADDSTGSIEELRPNAVLKELAAQRKILVGQLRAIGVRDFEVPPVSGL